MSTGSKSVPPLPPPNPDKDFEYWIDFSGRPYSEGRPCDACGHLFGTTGYRLLQPCRVPVPILSYSVKTRQPKCSVIEVSAKLGQIICFGCIKNWERWAADVPRQQAGFSLDATTRPPLIARLSSESGK